MRGAVALGMLLVATVAGGGQEPAKPQVLRRRVEEAAHVAATREVVLDVVVSDVKGHPVEGVRAGDLHLSEDGVEQTIETVVEHRAVEHVSGARPLARNTFNNWPIALKGGASTVILIDYLDTPPSAQLAVRDTLNRFVKTVAPGTAVAILSLETRIHTILGMTDDPEAMRVAMFKMSGQPVPAVMLGGLVGAPEKQMMMRRQIVRESMEELARYWATYPGRKNLIWMTGAVPMDLTQGARDDPFPDALETRKDGGTVLDVMTLNRIAVYAMDMRVAQQDTVFRGGGRGRGGDLGASPAANVSVRDGLRYLDEVATRTGGKAFYNANDLKNPVADAVALGSHFYTVTYRSSKPAADGMYRALKVQTVRPDEVVASRQGYFARAAEPPKEMAVTEAHAKALMDSAMAEGAIVPTEILFRAQIRPRVEVKQDGPGQPAPAGVFLDARLRERGYRLFDISYLANTGAMRFVRQLDGTYKGHLQFVALLYDGEGKRVGGVISRTTRALNQAEYDAMMGTGASANQMIAIPVKGKYVLRLAVFDVDGPLMGALEIPVEAVQVP